MDTNYPAEEGQERKIFSVSELNLRARQLLETHISLAWVEGEISNLARPGSGHWYFTLKDERSQIRCAMFKNRNQRLRFAPENGMKVMVRGRLSIYEARGDYQLIAENMEDAGLGALQRAYEQLKTRLAGLGWFDAELKAPLPSLPRHIGLITSPTGAAIHDMITVLKRRFPAIAVTLFPVQVQGDAAAEQIAAAIASANARAKELEPPLDVLIVGRGGGSLEDLWAFNQEIVASAIHDSVLPIVSAVGHETDFTIADFTADQRAPTPSAAAELLSPDQADWQARLADTERQLASQLANRIARQHQQLATLGERLKHPRRQLEEFNQRLDDMEQRLSQAANSKLAHQHLLVGHQYRHLAVLNPGERLPAERQRLDQLRQQLMREVKANLELKRHALGRNAELLESVSPLNTLKRGYAIVSDASGNIVKRTTDVKTNDQVALRLADGEISARIDKS